MNSIKASMEKFNKTKKQKDFEYEDEMKKSKRSDKKFRDSRRQKRDSKRQNNED